MKRPKLKRPKLDEIPHQVLPQGSRAITMSVGQKWDHLLDVAYERGWFLLELDDKERPVRLFRKQAP